MASVAFALPIKPGKNDAGLKFVEELTTGRSQEFHKRRQPHFERVRIWRQHTPSEMIIVCLEGPDVHGAMQSRAKEDHEFERWFDSKIEEITGHHMKNVSGKGAPAELLMDWHRDKGHAKSKSGH